jgi:hypothetical protein
LSRKLTLEEQIERFKPETDDFWEKHTITQIPGIKDPSRGIFVRKDEQLEFGVERGTYVWVTNQKLYDKLKKEGYSIIAFHKKHRIPCMFKPMDPSLIHYDWFYPPEEKRAREDEQQPQSEVLR